MCQIVALMFIGLVVLLLIEGPFGSGSSTPSDPPPSTHSYDFDHLALYGLIVWISFVLLVKIHDNKKKDTRRSLIVIAVVFIAGLLAFLVWNWDHDVPPPLFVTCRQSYIGKGYVLMIENYSKVPMYDIRVKVGNSNAVDNRVTDTLAPSASKEVGWMQLSNGKLETGEIAYVYARGYNAPVTIRM